jgi:tetratricopeptide (TPR) repeat protein
MIAECRRYVQRALSRLASATDRDPRREMHLQAALGMSLNYTSGPVPETEAAWTRTLEIAKSLGDTEYQLRALRGLGAHRANSGEYRAALALAHEFGDLAASGGNPDDLAVADRMAGVILYYLGDLTNARRRLERHLAHPVARVRHAQTVRFQIDHGVSVRALLSRILWCQGFPDQAADTARLAIDDAGAQGHALSLCHALAQGACPVALYNGDLPAAENFAAILQAKELGLSDWVARGHCFQGTVLIVRGNFAAGLPLLRDALDELRQGGAAPGFPAFLAVLARGLGHAGQVTEGLVAINEALARSERQEEGWFLPELLRVKGEVLLRQGGSTAARAAEDHFRRALDWARRQAALSWELRTGTGLARLQHGQGRIREARDLLASVYNKFTEGFDTADLQTAKRLLDAWSLD